ncbi:DUF1064 domain-containing protein [Enterococcus sp. BWB1-3]|uniref:DUF1064 domain-containing protein n=1 Tax=Enterococcus sp. BWB1-3 TaxID=2787713 RepID=UPI002ED3EDB4
MVYNKYSNKKITVDGIKFDSKAEARYYEKLKAAGVSFMPLTGKYCAMQEDIILQDSFVLDGKKHQPIKYKADFVFHDGQNIVKVVDVKGYQDSLSKLKMKMFASRYGFPVIFAKYERSRDLFIEMSCFESAYLQGQRAKVRAERKRALT